MKEVFKNLWVGPEKDVPKAREKGFAIVHACKDGLYSHRGLLGYHTMGAPKGPEYLVAKRGNELYLNLVDTDDPSFIPDEATNAALIFIREHLQKNEPVFVHCIAGKSRSPTIALLYLYSIGMLPQEYYKAVRAFKQIYPDYEPGLGMKLYTLKRIKQLKNIR